MLTVLELGSSEVFGQRYCQGYKKISEEYSGLRRNSFLLHFVNKRIVLTLSTGVTEFVLKARFNSIIVKTTLSSQAFLIELINIFIEDWEYMNNRVKYIIAKTKIVK